VSAAEEVRKCLAELRPVYDRVRELRGEWARLQTAEQAGAEFDRLLAEPKARLEALGRRRQELARELEARLGPVEPGGEVLPPPGPILPMPPKLRQRRDAARLPGPPDPRPPQPGQEGRKRLRELANRYWKRWGLEHPVLGEINQITDDASRSLGEALALLDWGVYERRAGAREKTDEDHLARLREWGEELRAYHARLTGQLNTFKSQHHGLLGIWELWSVRERSPEDRAAWEAFVGQARQALQEEMERVRQAVTELERRLAAAGGGP
jgi:hypothetical protein